MWARWVFTACVLGAGVAVPLVTYMMGVADKQQYDLDHGCDCNALDRGQR